MKSRSAGRTMAFVFISLIASVMLAGSSLALEEKEGGGNKSRSDGTGNEKIQKRADAAAMVNGVAIKKGDFEKSLQTYIRQRGISTQAITSPETFKRARRAVIDMLVNRELLWQDAESRNFVVGKEEVERTVAQIKSTFPSEEAFRASLSQGGYSGDEYEAFLKKELSIRKMVDAEIADSISISDEEAHDYYADNPDQFVMPEQVRARHILIKVDLRSSQNARDEAKEKIETILEEAKGGADFAELAEKYSEGPSAPQGGDLGFFSREQMVKPFSDAAFSLEPGGTSGIVQTIYGYHIIRVEERKEPYTLAEKDVQGQIREFLRSEKVREGVQNRVETLREEGKIDILLHL